MEWITNPEAWIALATLTVLEIVLGIDNVVFIAIVAGRLPEQEQGKAWKIGLSLAMLSRLALLFSIVWIMRLTAPLFSIVGHPFSGRDLILITGGLCLYFAMGFSIFVEMLNLRAGKKAVDPVKLRGSLPEEN
jgi:predicted tellurium resistance membrane protein TerC